jgi:hypothetical protein
LKSVLKSYNCFPLLPFLLAMLVDEDSILTLFSMSPKLLANLSRILGKKQIKFAIQYDFGKTFEKIVIS